VGNERVVNGTIDVGCGEYDFRPDFAARLSPCTVPSLNGYLGFVFQVR
jgi:hypothetical protein